MTSWNNPAAIGPKKYICGYCGDKVSSALGWYTNKAPQSHIFVCPGCTAPTFFAADGQQTPGVAPGGTVGNVPADVLALYLEARRAIAAGANTSAVLALRKLLMHIAVQKNAKAGEPFITYVEYLAGAGYVPPDGKLWVDHIRKKSNEANHEIVLMKTEDATELLTFSEMLLKFIYEFPARVPPATP